MGRERRSLQQQVVNEFKELPEDTGIDGVGRLVGLWTSRNHAATKALTAAQLMASANEAL